MALTIPDHVVLKPLAGTCGKNLEKVHKAVSRAIGGCVNGNSKHQNADGSVHSGFPIPPPLPTLVKTSDTRTISDATIERWGPGILQRPEL